MATQQSALDIAREFTDAIIASGFPLKKAFLFGSYAQNRQHQYSDIDLALVADEFVGVGYFDLKHFAKVKISTDKYAVIEAHTFNTAQFSNGDPFVKEIQKSGIPLI
jgi:predicted nucleotidyltransferase